MHTGGSRIYLSLACLVAGLGGLLFGFDTAVISGAEGPVAKQFMLSDFMEGWIVAAALVGCLIGAAVAGTLADRFGRKKVLLLAAVLFMLCSIGSAVPTAAWHLAVARIVGGMGIGIASMLSPMYIAEISPARLRGGLISTYQLAITVGIVMAYFSNCGLAYLANHHAGVYQGAALQWIFVEQVWRGMLLAGVLPASVLFLLLFFVPESPRWLTKQGPADAALDILGRINGPEQAAARDAGNRGDAGPGNRPAQRVVLAQDQDGTVDRNSAPFSLPNLRHQRHHLLRPENPGARPISPETLPCSGR